MRHVAADEVLVAEHEPAVAELIRRYLAKEGLNVRAVSTPEQVLAALAAPDPAAAVILDLTMPGLDARAIRKLVRAGPPAARPGGALVSRRGRPPARGRPQQAVIGAAPGIPVIFLTAGEATQAALGLRPRDIGAGEESCVTRPFGARTLAARVRAAVRAARTAAADPQATGNREPAADPQAAGNREPAWDPQAAAGPPGTGRLRLAPGRRQATLDGLAVALTGTEFDLLSCLLQSAGRTVSRDRLRQAVWGEDSGSRGRAVDVYIAQLRAKLGPGHGIRTVRGIGYVLDPGTARAHQVAAADGTQPAPQPGPPPSLQPGGQAAVRSAPATIGDAGHPTRGDNGTA